MKHIKTLAGILTACLLLTVVSCSPSDAPADTQTETETVAGTDTATETKADTKPVTETTAEPESDPSVDTYIFYGRQGFAESAYEELCIGEFRVHSGETMEEPPFGLNFALATPLIYTKVGRELPITTYVVYGWNDFESPSPEEVDITWSIAEPELLEVIYLNGKRLIQGCWDTVPSIEDAGMGVRTLSPGVAHLYITVTHRETGISFTLQQIIVIEES